MQHWHLPSVDANGRRNPRVLFSTPECRAVLIDLNDGEQLGEHSVRERAVLEVVSGSVRIEGHLCGAGTLVTFDPGERHDVQAEGESRVLLMLAPWPAPDHYPAGQESDPREMPRRGSAEPASD
jgi:redox-sensitive bicupin YhaK (pirin superfamily)